MTQQVKQWGRDGCDKEADSEADSSAMCTALQFSPCCLLCKAVLSTVQLTDSASQARQFQQVGLDNKTKNFRADVMGKGEPMERFRVGRHDMVIYTM